MTPDKEMQEDFESSGSIYPKVDSSDIESIMDKVQFDCHIVPGTTTTVITAFIPVGAVNFTLATEIMACIDPRNFNKEKGEKYGIEKAYAAAKNKLLELEGYRLANNIASHPKDSFERLIKEQGDLTDRLKKLKKFIGSEQFKGIDKNGQELLELQLKAMSDYEGILVARIDTLCPGD